MMCDNFYLISTVVDMRCDMSIFDLLQKQTYNIFFDEIKDPEDALYWLAINGNFRAQKAYLEFKDPAHYDPKSKEYKERIKQDNQPRVFIDDKYCIVCTKKQLKEQYPKTYLKYFGNEY